MVCSLFIRMPALNEHLLYVMFFVAVLVLCYFIYMNVVLAVVYNSYKRHLKVVFNLFLRPFTQKTICM